MYPVHHHRGTIKSNKLTVKKKENGPKTADSQGSKNKLGNCTPNQRQTLSLCIRETHKGVPLQMVKTQMKCRLMWHFIRVYTVCWVKKRHYFLSCNLTPPDMYNGLFQVYYIKPEGIIH